MFVWWAVFFFAGAIFPSCAAAAPAALGTISVLAAYPVRSTRALRSRTFLTCATGLFALVTASLTPIETGQLSGSNRPVISGTTDYISPVRAVRERVQSITDKCGLSEEARGLLRALIIADRKSLSRKTRRDWKNTGTAHYLALSGLHLGLVALPLFLLLTLAGTRGILRALMALFVLSFYAAVAGRPGSLLRALSMLGVMQTYRLAGVRICLARSVVAGAFLVCILDPPSLKNTGFLLSFNAAAGVALLGVPVCRSIKRRIAGRRGSRVMIPPLLALAMSLSVQAFMLPMTVRIFGFAPLIGPLMSVLMALPVTALLYGGFIYVIAGHIWSRFTSIPLNILSALTGFLVSSGAAISRAGIIISDFDAWLYIPGLAFCAAAFRTERHGRTFLIIGLALAAFSFNPMIRGRNAGEGEAIHFPVYGCILYGGNGGVLVMGKWPTAWSASRLTREVRRTGVRSIDMLIILEPGGLDVEGISILAGDLGPARVLVSPWHEESCSVPVECEAVRSDTVLTTGSLRLVVHAPEVMPGRGAFAGRNEASLFISQLD